MPISSGESESDRESDFGDEIIEIDTDELEYIPGQEIIYKNSFFPSIKQFTSASGIRENIELDGTDPIHYFKIFLDEHLLKLICEETNRFQDQNPEQERVNMTKWVDLEEGELMKFLALSILMGHVRKGQLEDYWSTSPMLSTPIFPKTMTRNRYRQILRFLHFTDNNVTSDHPLKKLKPVIDHLKAKFGTIIYPSEKLCIDESLVLWKGRLAFKQYLPLKRHRFGIKLFELVDCESGIILDFIVYTGGNTDFEKFDLGVSGDVVAHMMKPYFNKGHILYVDNWYSSPKLAEFLHDKDTGLCGTIKKNRKGLPLLNSKLAKGEVELGHNMIWMAIQWQDKKEVYMITSVHEFEYSETGKRDWSTGEMKMKPSCIINYNKNMGGIDMIDKQLSLTETVRKSMKWYKKLFFHLIDMVLINAHAMYNMNNTRLSFPEFRMKLVADILQLTDELNVSNDTDPARLVGKHLPVFSEKKKRCVLCLMTKKRAESKFQCSKCSIPLCITPCFYTYHTKKNLP